MALNISRLQALCGTLAVGLAFSGAVYLGSSVAHAGQPRTATAATAAQELPPLSYVCTMPGDEDVIDDKPGTCPKCGMKLVPVRLDAKWWCPVHQSLEVHDGPGKCRRDGRDLVQVTVSETWTCSDEPDAKHLEPGKCGDGTPRKIKYEVRAHGDHNPRHGGQFFMASDAWHHIEGTYPQAGLFRVFFYDNFTKPLAAKTFGGTVVVRDASDKEIARAQLAPGPVDNTLEARIPAAQAGLPLRVTASIRFSATGKEQGFDFQFNEYSKDPGTPSASLRQPAVERAAMVRTVEPRPAARPASAVQSVRGSRQRMRSRQRMWSPARRSGRRACVRQHSPRRQSLPSSPPAALRRRPLQDNPLTCWRAKSLRCRRRWRRRSTKVSCRRMSPAC